MNTRVHFVIHILIAVATLAMLGVAFSQPLAALSMGDNILAINDDIYITKECGSVSGSLAESKGTGERCGDLDQLWKPHMQAIMGIAIALMACIVLQFLGKNFGSTVSYAFGVLVLALAIALIVLVALLTAFSRGDKSNTYKLTGTSIGVLVVAGLLVLFELCCNRLVHQVVLAPYRMIAGKRA